MPALRKLHRVAFLLPDLAVAGVDAAYGAEAALLLWMACIETCRRHPGLAVYDSESTPLLPYDGHFAPQYAQVGATPRDAFYESNRRDELVWLQLELPKGVVRLHVLGRDGQQASFDAIGRTLGEQLHQVLERWLGSRSLGPLPKRIDPFTGEELLAAIRVLGPALVDHARKWQAPVPKQRAHEPGDDSDSDADPPVNESDGSGDEIDAALSMLGTKRPKREAPRASRGIANRLLPPLKVAALRVLEVAMDDDLSELLLAADPEHPSALFAKFLAGGKRDVALLRRVIAASPGWGRPYSELAAAPDATALEVVAGAGMAALCRPAQLDIVDTAAEALRDDGRADEAVRLAARATRLHDRESRAHISLLQMHRSTDRVGAWLAQAHRSAYLHGCPMDPHFPWYPDQIQIDLLLADALMHAGRLDEAIALRANRLEGREATWPRHTRILQTWRKDPRFVAWCFAREGHFRGDPARAVEGFGRVEPDDNLDVAVFLDALVAMGREDEIALAWAHFGLGRGFTGPVARLAAARGLLAAGDWRRGLEELWRVQLAEPVRDEQVAIARCGRMLALLPLEVAETALAERMAVGAISLARRMARDIADFVPGAAKSSIVTRALGKGTAVELDPTSFAGFASDTPGRAAIDALFAELEVEAGGERSRTFMVRRAARLGTKLERAPVPVIDPTAQADRLVNRWLEVAFTAASEDDPVALARAAAYTAAQALGRYLAITTVAPTPVAGGLRTVAAEALALVRQHRDALTDRDARALLAVVDPLLRRVDRWVGANWLGAVERACAIEERAAGDVAGFARDCATVAARILGPEEEAVLAISLARLHRDRPEGWHSPAAAQASRLTVHTGSTGADEWADATAAQLAARTLEVDDALDALHSACYLAEGRTAGPAIQTARVLFDAGRAAAAIGVLSMGIAAATPAERDRALASFAAIWGSNDLPIAFDRVATGVFEALQKPDLVRAEKLGRWAVALDPSNGEAHRNLGLALAQQGKVVDALHHLTRATREQATQILSGVLYQAGKHAEATAVLDYASRWYARADQWLTYAGIAYGAMDNPRAVKAYGLAYQLDPEAFDATQLNAYAGVLDEVGDYVTCEKVANHLLRVAGDDVMWKTNAWNHLACALIGRGKYEDAAQLAEQAVAHNPLPDNAAGFTATLERARTKTKPTPPALPSIRAVQSPVFALLEAGDFATAAALLAGGPRESEPSWRARRGALAATRFRFASENAVEVTPRARAAAAQVLADSIATTDRDAAICRVAALEIREQAYFARDPVPRLGDRMTRDAFYREFRARGGVVLGEAVPKPAPFVDRVVVPGAKVARASDFVALLRDLAALPPREALAQFDLDDTGYLEVARAWGSAFENDPSLAATIAAGLARTTSK